MHNVSFQMLQSVVSLFPEMCCKYKNSHYRRSGSCEGMTLILLQSWILSYELSLRWRFMSLCVLLMMIQRNIDQHHHQAQYSRSRGPWTGSCWGINAWFGVQLQLFSALACHLFRWPTWKFYVNLTSLVSSVLYSEYSLPHLHSWQYNHSLTASIL